MGFAQNYEVSAPSPSYGYYRGTPYYQGSGSGMGQNVAGANAYAAGQGGGGTTDWHPSILYLFVFIFAEMIVFGILSRHI